MKDNIYLFYGEEKHKIKNEIAKIKSKFQKLEQGVNFFNITKDNIDTLGEVCNNITFFGESKLIIIKDTNLKFDISKLSNIGESTYVIIIEDTVDKRLTTYKEISKIANVKEFKYMNDNEMTSYVISLLKKYNISINQDVARYFVQVCGVDETNNINELNKLVIYLGEIETVTKDIIDKVCVKNLSAKIFDMLNDIINKRHIKAINELEQMLMLKEPIVKIYIMLYKQINQMYMIKLLKQKNESDISKKLGIHPFMYKDLNIASDKYTKEDLEKILLMFDNYDEKTKIGEMNFEIGLKKIICAM